MDMWRSSWLQIVLKHWILPSFALHVLSVAWTPSDTSSSAPCLKAKISYLLIMIFRLRISTMSLPEDTDLEEFVMWGMTCPLLIAKRYIQIPDYLRWEKDGRYSIKPTSVLREKGFASVLNDLLAYSNRTLQIQYRKIQGTAEGLVLPWFIHCSSWSCRWIDSLLWFERSSHLERYRFLS